MTQPSYLWRNQLDQPQSPIPADSPDPETDARAVAAGARIWSPMQSAIFSFVADGSGHGVVEALAGTGKSTTIEEAVRRAPNDAAILVCAFNKSIAESMKARLGDTGCDIMTLHSLGLKAVTAGHGRREVDGRAAMGLLRKVSLPSPAAFGACKKLLSIAKGSLLSSWEELDEAADSYGIDIEPRERKQVLAAAIRILREQGASRAGLIDYDDMIWLPAVQSLPVPRYEYVFVDETQDLNPAQLWLVKAACAEGGRIIVVGDRRQAIYGFRGADSQAIPRMIQQLSATVLPLSITYRCPQAVVREANRFVPELQAAPGAPQGIVRTAGPQQLHRAAQPGDMVLSRVNAPLISQAFAWLAEGRRCRIQGRDIGAGLVKLIESLAKKSARQDVAGLMAALRAWHSVEASRLAAADRDTQEVDDKAACIEALAAGRDSLQEVTEAATALFADDGAPGILLSSTHRAKGLEANRVWLLWDTYRPGQEGGAAGFRQQEERNLCYVAITRAKKELVYVTKEVDES